MVNMEKLDVGVGIRSLKHPRWSPSPVDLSLSNTLNSPPPNLTGQLGIPLNGLGVLNSHQLNALGSLNNQFNLGNLSSLTLNSLSSLTNNPSSRGQHLTSTSSPIFSSRKQREFIPDEKKDHSYWDRRRRNNEAAKRSREKRRVSDILLETKVIELTRENSLLKTELFAIKDKFGLPQNALFVENENNMISLSENRGRRDKIIKTLINTAGNDNVLHLQPKLTNNSSANSMINVLNGTSNSNSLLHSCTSGRSYVPNSPNSCSSESVSPHLNMNSSLNSLMNSTNKSLTNNCAKNGILAVNKNINNTDRNDLSSGNNTKDSLNALYSNEQNLFNNSLAAAYHDQSGRRNSSDHEEENNINNLNSLIANQNDLNHKLDQNMSNRNMMPSFDLMEKCITNSYNDEVKFGHLSGLSKNSLNAVNAFNSSVEKANRLLEENFSQSNNLPFKLRHKARNSPSSTDQTSDTNSESVDSPTSHEQILRKIEMNKTKEQICSEEEDEFVEVELESDEENIKAITKENSQKSSYKNIFPSGSDSDSEKFQNAIESKAFTAQATLNLFRNLASIPNNPHTTFTPYTLNCQLNNALQFADQ